MITNPADFVHGHRILGRQPTPKPASPYFEVEQLDAYVLDGMRVMKGREILVTREVKDKHAHLDMNARKKSFKDRHSRKEEPSPEMKASLDQIGCTSLHRHFKQLLPHIHEHDQESGKDKLTEAPNSKGERPKLVRRFSAPSSHVLRNHDNDIYLLEHLLREEETHRQHLVENAVLHDSIGSKGKSRLLVGLDHREESLHLSRIAKSCKLPNTTKPSSSSKAQQFVPILSVETKPEPRRNINMVLSDTGQIRNVLLRSAVLKPRPTSATSIHRESRTAVQESKESPEEYYGKLVSDLKNSMVLPSTSAKLLQSTNNHLVNEKKSDGWDLSELGVVDVHEKAIPLTVEERRHKVIARKHKLALEVEKNRVIESTRLLQCAKKRFIPIVDNFSSSTNIAESSLSPNRGSQRSGLRFEGKSDASANKMLMELYSGSFGDSSNTLKPSSLPAITASSVISPASPSTVVSTTSFFNATGGAPTADSSFYSNTVGPLSRFPSTISFDDDPSNVNNLLNLRLPGKQLEYTPKLLSGEELENTGTMSAFSRERDVLTSVFLHCNGNKWKRSKNWNTKLPVGSWEGVVVNYEGLVCELHLDNNNLEGDFPDIRDLRYLEVVHVDDNKISGHLHSVIVVRLSRLEVFSAQRNQLTGDIPFMALAQLKNLRELWLSGNQFQGEVHWCIARCRKLTHLCLQANQLTGPIPPTIRKLMDLQVLQLGDNQLTGEIPEAMKALFKLSHLSLSSNKLTGTVPEWFEDFEFLYELHLYGNNFSGHVPMNAKELYDHKNLKRRQTQARLAASGKSPAMFADKTASSKHLVSETNRLQKQKDEEGIELDETDDQSSVSAVEN